MGNQVFWCQSGSYSPAGDGNNPAGCSSEILFPDLTTAFSVASYSELVAVNANLNASVAAQNSLTVQMTKMQDSITQTNALLVAKVNTFSEDLRKSINARFDQMPAELANSDAIKQLRQDILKKVDDEISAKLKQ